MKWICFFLLIGIAACTNDKNSATKDNTDTTPLVTVEELEKLEHHDQDTTPIELYSNETFKDVRVVNTGADTYTITGTARVFEAAFSWVVEDGHQEILEGHNMTDAGAPEWGKFNFTITASKKDADSILYLVLFEASAKDGSRQHELPIPLH